MVLSTYAIGVIRKLEISIAIRYLIFGTDLKQMFGVIEFCLTKLGVILVITSGSVSEAVIKTIQKRKVILPVGFLKLQKWLDISKKQTNNFLRSNYALITAPHARDAELMKRLDAVAGRVLNPNEGDQYAS